MDGSHSTRPADGPRAASKEPVEDSQPFPALTALLIAIIISATRWIDWALKNAVPVITSPRFTGAVKDAGTATIPIVQKVAWDVYKWYTTAGQAEAVKLSLPKHSVPCNTTQSFTFGMSMPGVNLNMQYQATSTPQLQAGQPATIEASNQKHSSHTSTAQERLAIEAPHDTTLQQRPAQSTSLLGRARDSVAAVSRMQVRTLAFDPIQTALHPVRTYSNLWQLSTSTKASVAPAS